MKLGNHRRWHFGVITVIIIVLLLIIIQLAVDVFVAIQPTDAFNSKRISSILIHNS